MITIPTGWKQVNSPDFLNRMLNANFRWQMFFNHDCQVAVNKDTAEVFYIWDQHNNQAWSDPTVTV